MRLLTRRRPGKRLHERLLPDGQPMAGDGAKRRREIDRCGRLAADVSSAALAPRMKWTGTWSEPRHGIQVLSRVLNAIRLRLTPTPRQIQISSRASIIKPLTCEPFTFTTARTRSDCSASRRTRWW
jgi:hypothetical protein